MILVLAYPFNICPLLSHANIPHLLCNALCIYFTVNNRLINKWIVYPILLIIGTIALGYTPTAVGFSGALFAMAGINLMAIRTRNYIVSLFAYFAITFFVPAIAFKVHLIGFILGVFVGLSALLIKNWNEDC